MAVSRRASNEHDARLMLDSTKPKNAMTEQPLVSVVIPAYNHGDFLDASISSVLGQDYARTELIVIDDGSTDNTGEVLKKYAGRFHFESQANAGQVATLNRGWQMSRGEILAYLSADDLLLPNAVSRAVTCLTRNPDAVLAYCDFNLIDPHSQVVRRVTTAEFDYGIMVSELLCFPGPGAFFRRSAFEMVGGWDRQFRQMPDFEYWLRLGLCGRFVRIPAVLAAFRVHPGSQTFSSQNPNEAVRIVRQYFARTDLPSQIKALESKATSNAHLLSAQLHLRAGSYRLGADNLRRAFTVDRANFFKPMLIRRLANALFNRIGHRLLWKIKRIVRT